jgi:membrane protein DedA with SNARE-associated domain
VAKLKLSEFVLFAVLIYVGFMVSDWISKAVGLESWGIVGTLIILILPVAIIYYVWKQWLQKAAD